MTYYKTFSGGQFQRGAINSDGTQGLEERAGRLMMPPSPELAARVTDLAQRFAAFKAPSSGSGGCTEFEFFGTGPTVPTELERQQIASVAGC
jgi:hypothetical protein